MARTGLPRYCNKCGKELITNEVYREYDIFTGEPIDIIVTMACPDYVKAFFGTKNNGHYNSKIDIVDGQINS